MDKELLFGTAYYPEYMPYERIEKDLMMMRDAGMNVVRIAESTWSTLEPESGVFDFSYIDGVLDQAEKIGLWVIIGTPTYAVPSWLVKKDPDVMVTTREGRAAYGARQIINFLNPTFRSHAERVIRALLEHTAGRECVIGFQIDNETKHYGNYGQEVQQLFREYLKEKFKTTENLNQAFYLSYWSNAIHNWEDFPDMKGCVNGGLAGEFEKFRRRMAADYLDWQSKIVQEYRHPEQFITQNMDFEWKKFGADIAQDGYSYGIQPDINHSQVSKALTIAGCDIYHPTQDDLTGAEIAFGGDEIRCLKHDNYLVIECQAQAFKYWTPYPGQLRLHAYSHLASGACGLLYWNWHSIHNGYETYWRGLLSHDLAENPTYLEACRVGAEWKKLCGQIGPIKKQNQVALVVDNHSLTALDWFPIDKDLSYNDVVRWMYDSLYELNIECDVVDINELIPEQYRMIITPALYSVKEETVQALKTFVQNGGVLVSSFRSFVADEYLSVYHDTLPHLLHECFGVKYNQFTEPGKMTLLGRPVQYFAELLQQTEAECLARYEHKYWGQYVGMSRCAYGKGYGYYIGCYTEKELLKDLYLKAACDADIAIFDKDLRWPVIIRKGETREGKQLYFILHYSEEERSIVSPWNGKDLLTGRTYMVGEEIVLKDWDVLVLEAL